MKKGDYILAIVRSKQSVFSVKDILMLWGEAGTNAASVRINDYTKKGKLYHIRRGIYAKDKNYNKLELATKIFTPSYVSFETVLAQAGIIFQYYGQIFVASYLTRDILADRQKYSYKKIKNTILTHSLGVTNNDNCSIASAERAFLDVIYLYKDYHFDNLSPLNWKKVYEILPIYGDNKRMQNTIEEYRKAVEEKRD